MFEKKYTFSVSWSEEDEGFLGTVREFELLMAFGKTPQKALKRIIKTVKEAWETMNDAERIAHDTYWKKTER